TGGGLSPKTLKSHMTVFKLIFNLARKKKIIYDDCLEFVKLPTLSHEKVNFYSAEEVQKVWEAIKDDRIFHIIFATIYFGMRRSEVLGLRWDAIDFRNKMLIVKHTVVMYNNKVVAKDSTKTDASNRTYPLSDDMIEFFKWLKAREEEERAACGKDYIENDYIFKWPNGKTYDPDYISKHFKKLLEKNDLKRIRFHDLRHSCAALLLPEGRELYDVSEWLGHSDVNITAKFYGHLDMNRKRALGNTLGNSIGFKTGV
ncbi:MAG: site-specific integrase, partial [Clostridia bacterium]|nr:site-specific integrase [Clostridia bacterium]